MMLCADNFNCLLKQTMINLLGIRKCATKGGSSTLLLQTRCFGFKFSNPLQPSKLHKYELLIKKYCAHSEEALKLLNSHQLRDLISVRDVDLKPLSLEELISLRYALDLPVNLWIEGKPFLSETRKTNVSKLLKTVLDDGWQNYELITPIIHTTDGLKDNRSTNPNNPIKNQGPPVAVVCRPPDRLMSVIRMTRDELDDSYLDIGKKENYRTAKFEEKNEDGFDPYMKNFNHETKKSYEENRLKRRQSPGFFHSVSMDDDRWEEGGNGSQFYDRDKGMSWKHVDYENYESENDKRTMLQQILKKNMEFDPNSIIDGDSYYDENPDFEDDGFGTPLYKSEGDFWRLGPRRRSK